MSLDPYTSCLVCARLALCPESVDHFLGAITGLPDHLFDPELADDLRNLTNVSNQSNTLLKILYMYAQQKGLS